MEALIKKGDTKRERYIDIVKGLSILSITFLHYEDGLLNERWNVFISMFMISMFYFTAGWVDALTDKRLTTKELAMKRWKQLGIPYLCWSLIILSFDLILFVFRYYDLYFIGREVYKTLTLRGIGTLWFLPALFGGELIWNWLKDKKRLYIILAFGLTLVYQHFYAGFFAGKEGQIYKIIDAPFRSVSSILNAWIIIGAGYYAYKLIRFCGISRYWFGAIGVLLIVGAYWGIPYVHVPYVISISECLGLILIFYSCQYWGVWGYFDYWGRNSLSLMVTHYSITLVICKIVVENVLDVEFYGWVTIVAFGVSMLLQYFITILLNKKYPYLLGKNGIKYLMVKDNNGPYKE